MAPDDIGGTETWTEQILAAIADSKAMIVLISAASNRSSHVSREVNLAIGRNRAVLPIRIENVATGGSLEYLLSLVQRLDAFPPPITDHRDRVVHRLQSIIQRPPPDPVIQEAPTEPTPKSGPTETPVPDVPPREPTLATRQRASDIRPGSVVGAFTVDSLLDEGGMATVYRARQAEPSRLVALKVIRADHAADDNYRRRFLAEKETLAALEHPSIVPIYAAGDSNGVLFIAMRLIDGPDLQARITSQGRLSLRETVEILKPIADAVDYAHSAGVIHRDLKPSNIILDRAARPYLTDFGLGKHTDVGSDLSAPGLAIGTLDYMAPEQFSGGTDAKPGVAIDIYALGCVAFQCLTGQAPFARDTPEQLMYAHVHEAPPSVRSIRSEYPPEIDVVFARVLAKDPAARFATAREFVAALESMVVVMAGQTRSVVGGPPSATGRARRWLGANTALAVGGAAVAIVLVAVLGASLLFKSPGGSPGPTSAAAATGGSGPTAPVPTVTNPTSVPTSLPLSVVEAQLHDRLPVFNPAASGCTSWPTSPGAEDVISPSGYATSLARLTCPGPDSGGPEVRYAMYPDLVTLDGDFASIMTAQSVAAGGDCTKAIPANAPWSFPSVATAGDLACYVREGRVQYVWTDHELRILGQWLAPNNAAGLAFWRLWEGSRTVAEQALLDDLPGSVDDAGGCVRAADRYYLAAFAIVACPRAGGQNSVYYAQFPAADAFPADPMTTQFFALLEAGGVPDDTSTGCFQSSFGRYTWGYKTDDVVGATEGYIGCYQRTDTTPATPQIVWTFNRLAIMGLWTPPDIDSATALFNAWTAEVR